MEDRLLTPEEVASILAVSPKSVREWLRRGKLKGVKAGRLWRVRKRDLDTYLDLAVQTSERVSKGKTKA
jgi:excisionase family DNA binding protein